MFKLSVSGTFSAAHQLREYEGECEHLHGHNWKVEVTVIGDELDPKGLLLDFKVLKERLREVLEELDHTFLNDHFYFSERNPTSENLVFFIFKKMKDGLAEHPHVKVKEVTVWESEGVRASYVE